MTNTAPVTNLDDKRAHRPKTGMGLWVNDVELSEVLGVPMATLRPALERFDADARSGFPRKEALWGGRRYLPDVRAWLDKRYGRNMAPTPAIRRDND